MFDIERCHARARAIFPNQGMHRNAQFIAGLHARAIEYLEQAPVLAAGFGVKASTKADRLYIAMRVGGPIERGERLRNVMAALDLPMPLRKLTGYAITPNLSGFVRELKDIDPSSLSQCIPDTPGKQRDWLKALREWRWRMGALGQNPRTGFVWAARHAHQFEEGQASDFADFLGRQTTIDIGRWSYERMSNEVQLWHDRLAAGRALNAGGLTISPDMVIDLSDWPDNAEVDGFEFFKLSTPSMLMEEGRRMRHCVASYIPQVMAGRCHIYSVRADMRRMATVEIIGNRAVQIKAFANKAPSRAVEAATHRFTEIARLKAEAEV